jgi:diphthamide biosynthesis protein 3
MSDDENISIYDEIEIEDMTFDEALGVYHYPCPCGDKFQIALDDLLDEQDIAVCPSCSLMIRVIFDLVCRTDLSSCIFVSDFFSGRPTKASYFGSLGRPDPHCRLNCPTIMTNTKRRALLPEVFYFGPRKDSGLRTVAHSCKCGRE